MKDPLVAVLVVGGIGFVLRAVVSEMVKQEYTRWAPALARAVVRLAGHLHPTRADEWLADILYLQSTPEASTGLWEALCHLCGAPKLAARAILAACADAPLFRRGGSARRSPAWECDDEASLLGRRDHVRLVLAGGVALVSLITDLWAGFPHPIMTVLAAMSVLLLVGGMAGGVYALWPPRRHR